jgi:hypothetical protein
MGPTLTTAVSLTSREGSRRLVGRSVTDVGDVSVISDYKGLSKDRAVHELAIM